MEKQKNNRQKIFKIFYFIRFKIPTFIILQVLYVIGFVFLSYAFINSEFDKIYITLLSIIGINVSLSSCSFAYSKTKKGIEKNNLIKVGEHFLFSAVSMTISIIFIWSASKLKQFLPNSHWYFQAPAYFLYIFSMLYLVESLETLNKGLNYLFRNLFFKVDI